MAGRGRKGAHKIGYAVVGLGHIAQHAVLPAFANAKSNSRLVALVSSDKEKLEELGKKYKVEKRFSYDDYDACLRDEEVDAVYIALPNNMHAEYTTRAAAAGVHVLCEKPMAITEEECERMIRACRENDVRLMIAYRLHFDKANLTVVDLVKSGKIGAPKLFASTFSYQVKEENIRTRAELGGGPVWDIGIYCINAARYLFRSEPDLVSAIAVRSADPRFREIDESVTTTLRFPDDKLATFAISYGSAPTATFRLVGTEGDVLLDNAYEYEAEIEMRVTQNEKKRERTFAVHDQFGPELIYFSDCVLEGKEPEPSGLEGLADVRIIRALHESIQAQGRPVEIEPVPKETRPEPEQELHRPPVTEESLVDAEAPHD